jgi:two-component system, NarL family, response regulator LiaR
MISVLIVEDQIEHQTYLRTVLNSDPDIKCIGIFRFALDAIKEIKQKRPDVAIIDIGLPDISGIECVRRLKLECPHTKLMVCTIQEEDNDIFEALKAGADSYMVKRSKPYQILDAIKEVQAGEMPISSCIASKVLNYLKLAPEAVKKGREEYGITMREEEILKLLSKGHSYQEIAQQLFISVATLKWHVHNIYKKLQADNRTEALNKYFDNKNGPDL